MLHARVQYNLLRSVSDRAVMLRQQASRLISSCLTTRAAQLSDSAPDCQRLVWLGTQSLQGSSPLQSLSAWIVDSGLYRAAQFSTSSLSSSATVSDAERRAAAQSSAESDEHLAQQESPESPAGTEAAMEDSYADFTAEQLRQSLLEKDKAITSSTAQAEELTDLLKRTLADMDNLRQRTAKQAESSQRFAIQGFLKSLLDVGDNLERAFNAVPPQALQGKDHEGNTLSIETSVSLLNGIVNGLQLTEKIFHQALRENGVEKFRPEGDKFDPNLHEALFELPDPKQEPGTVGAVTKTGYLLNGRVVRPAQVGVVRKPS